MRVRWSARLTTCQRPLTKDTMHLFCPNCANLLVVEEGPQCFRFACNTCPYVQNIDKKVTCACFNKLQQLSVYKSLFRFLHVSILV